MNNARINAAAKAQKVPPFLKKLVDLTNSCPPHIGAWSEDGSHFVVRSSQFADLLREQFQGTLQTFVRQLHFYSFNKKDDVSTGMWTFSHPHFLRGQPHLLVNIGRKSNPKRKKNSKGDDDDDDKDSASDHPGPAANNQAIEQRLNHLERQMTRMHALEREVQALKQELTQLKELGVARDLLSLAPGISTRKRPSDESSSTCGDKNSLILMSAQMQHQQQSTMPMSKSIDKDEMLSLLPPPLKKVNRMTSVDSAFELKDFPFEDTSSLGSVSVRDLMRELQYGIFADFDEFIPAVSKFTGSDHVIPSTPMSDSSSAEAASAVGSIAGGTGACGNKEDFFKIPTGFVLQPGVTMSLLRSTFNVIAKLCCPNNTGNEGPDSIRKLCDDLPHPSTLPPVENCEISLALLPILRNGVEEKATDIALMRSARQVYEVYYGCVMKKLQEKGCSISRAAGGSVPAASQLSHQRSM